MTLVSGEDAFGAVEVVRAPRELVALGGLLDPATLRAAYRAGCFPWPASGPHERALDRQVRRLARRGAVPLLPGTPPGVALVPWCSPHPRAVLLPRQLRLPRSLRQRLRRCGWTTTADTAFAQVLAACADRAQTWITPPVRAAYLALHAEGDAHSVEVWDGGKLVGGLYGVRTGAVFSGESMFHRADDASKVAVVDLCDRLVEGGGQLVDTQQQTAHLMQLGQLLVGRQEYVEAVRALRDLPTGLPGDRRPVHRLVTGSAR